MLVSGVARPNSGAQQHFHLLDVGIEVGENRAEHEVVHRVVNIVHYDRYLAAHLAVQDVVMVLPLHLANGRLVIFESLIVNWPVLVSIRKPFSRNTSVWASYPSFRRSRCVIMTPRSPQDAGLPGCLRAITR